MAKCGCVGKTVLQKIRSCLEQRNGQIYIALGTQGLSLRICMPAPITSYGTYLNASCNLRTMIVRRVITVWREPDRWTGRDGGDLFPSARTSRERPRQGDTAPRVARDRCTDLGAVEYESLPMFETTRETQIWNISRSDYRYIRVEMNVHTHRG